MLSIQCFLAYYIQYIQSMYSKMLCPKSLPIYYTMHYIYSAPFYLSVQMWEFIHNSGLKKKVVSIVFTLLTANNPTIQRCASLQLSVITLKATDWLLSCFIINNQTITKQKISKRKKKSSSTLNITDAETRSMFTVMYSRNYWPEFN